MSVTLSGCEGAAKGDYVAPTQEVIDAIAARKANYKEIGGAFKTISDEIKTGAPDLNTIGPMAQEIYTRAGDQLKYFPSGSGMESGEKTRAKAEIWRDLATFTASHEKFVAAAERLVAAGRAADVAAIKTRYGELGATCKDCHDRFRERD